MRYFVLALAGLVYYFFFSDYSGCDKYASKFSCDYVEKKATYDVYYWKSVYENNPSDERYIGTVVGIDACRDLSRGYSVRVKDSWTERSYICMLNKEGENLEKHRKIW
jgi:hypothetical protein